jgi:hypothetical protein
LPFTLAHPAAVVPLHGRLGRYGVLSALIVGSVVPDLVYLIPHLEGPTSHSLLGVAIFDVPVGLLCYVLYHWCVAPLAFALLPAVIRQRMGNFRPGELPSRDPAALLVSLAIGALTHVGWDAVTHASGLPRFVPLMPTQLFSVWGYSVSVYKLLQHSSTVLGVVLLTVWTRRWLDATPASAPCPAELVSPARKLALLALILLPGIVVGLLAAWPALSANVGALRISQLFAGLAVVNGGRVFLVTSLLAGIAWRLKGPREIVPRV